MKRDSVGTVEFDDLDSLQPSLIVVSGLPNGGLVLWMDQNNTHQHGWGSDCDVGFDGAEAERLLRSLRAAKKLSDSGPKRGWEPVDSIAYSWCDQDEISEGPAKPERPGRVALLARRGVVRIVVVPKDVESFVFTLPGKAALQLIELVRAAVSA